MTLRSSVRLAAVYGALFLTASLAHAGKMSREATIDRFVAPDGQNYFAVAVRADNLPAFHGSRVHAILVDTSASQVGEHRTESFRVLDELLTHLKPADSVRLFAVDSQIRELTTGAVAVSDAKLRDAVAQLHRQVPLGASNFLQGLSTAAKAIADAPHGDIVGLIELS